MRTFFHDFSFIKHNDFISISHRTDSVSNNNLGHTRKFSQNMLNFKFSFSIKCRSRIIQDKHRSFSGKRSCNCNALLLSATQTNPSFTNNSLLFFFHFIHKLSRMRFFQRHAYLSFCHSFFRTKTNISVNCITEKENILHNTRNRPSQNRKRNFFNISSIHLDNARSSIIHSFQKIYDSSFSRTSSSHNSKRLPSFYLKTYIMQNLPLT